MKLFLVGMLAATISILPGILDLTMVPRFICLSIILLITLYKLSKSEINLKIDLIFAAYSAFTIFTLLSVVWAKSFSEAVFDSGKLVLSFLVFCLIYFFQKKNKPAFLNGLIKMATVAALLSLCVGLYQLVMLHNFSKESMYLVSGLNSHKNLMSSFLFLTLPFMIFGTFTLKGIWKAATFAGIIVALLFILILRTKAVWIGLAISLLVFLLLFLSKKMPLKRQINPFFKIVILILVANIFFIFILPPVIKKNISSVNTAFEKSSNMALQPDQERLIVWDKTYDLINKKPLIGCGAGNWQIYFPDATLTGLWRVEDLNVTFQRPHNDFLWIIGETGYLGLNLFLLFLTSLLVFGSKVIYATKQNSLERNKVLLLISTIIGFYVVSFFDFPKERTEHLVWINCLMALLYFEIKSHDIFPVFFNIKVRKPIIYVLVLMPAFFLYVGLLRFKGEYFTRLLYDYKNAGRVANVIKSGKAAISFAYTIDPTSVPIHWYTGNAQANLGNYAMAEKDFVSAYQFNPYNRNVLNDLASAYVFNKQNDSAIKLYEEAARISPRFDDPKLNLAAIYIGNNSLAKAEFWLHALMHNSERRTSYEKFLEIQKSNAKQ